MTTNNLQNPGDQKSDAIHEAPTEALSNIVLRTVITLVIVGGVYFFLLK